jgi:hypothetical protein
MEHLRTEARAKKVYVPKTAQIVEWQRDESMKGYVCEGKSREGIIDHSCMHTITLPKIHR